MKHLCLELKVCEGCGVLWLRRELEKEIYCNPCAIRLADFPPVRMKRGGGRPRTSTRIRRCSGQRRNQDGAQ
ncbi:MAG TPA: hypothetical protein VGN01_12795 [Acidobacteriaceae bacterium]|jgi:hypothetical protein